MNIELNKEERNDIIISLGMRCNYIETGTLSVGSSDILRMGEKTAAKLGYKIKPLSEEQMEGVLRMRKLTRRLYDSSNT